MVFGQAPTIQRSNETRVRELFADNSLGALVTGVTDAIYQSFKENGLRSKEVSDTEKRMRFKILMDWAIVLRADLKWGVQRIVDAMPEILKTELNGKKWEPTKRQCWIPQDGR